MHPVESGGCRARLVALQMADEVPCQRKAFESLDLCGRVLKIIFAKVSQAGPHRLFDRAHRLTLANAEKPHFGRIPATFAGRGGDPVQHGTQINRDVRHFPWPGAWLYWLPIVSRLM